MTTATREARLTGSVLSSEGGFGEPLRVVATDAVIAVAFWPQGLPPKDTDWAAGAGGAAAGMARLVNPVALASAPDAELLALRAVVEVREEYYEIVALEPDGGGALRVELTAAAASA